MLVDAGAVSFVINPVTLVDIAIRVDQAAFSVGLVSNPEACVFGSIDPGLGTHALSTPCQFVPLTQVNGTIIKFYWSPFL